MGRSLSLAAYRAMSWRKTQPSPAAAPVARPDGAVLWLHATSSERLTGLCDFAVRLKALRPSISILTTLNQSRSDTPDGPERGNFQLLGSDHPATVRQFMDHWRPDMCVWTGGDLMPNLITLASERGLPMVLLDISDGEVPTRRHRWLPDLARATLDCFDTIMTQDETAADRIRRIGLAPDKISATARLRSGASPPPCRESDLIAANRDLGGRPVWLAAAAQPAEFATILAAHRIALRLVHRLLLVISLADPKALADLEQILTDTGLRFGNWDAGDPVGEEIQVIISSDPADLGLWYRVSPLSFVASTFERGPGARSPLEPAALGSAVLHGPNIRDFRRAFNNLASAGAAQEVRDDLQLGAAVVRLIAPDEAARMALAGWEVVTEGADLTDRLIDLVQDLLDLQESTRAGA